MHYWIFVHKSEDVNNSFPQLMKLKNWGFKFSQPITKKIKAVQKGDIVIFYVGILMTPPGNCQATFLFEFLNF